MYANVMIAEEMLKALETQIEKFKSQKFKVSCPQCEEGMRGRMILVGALCLQPSPSAEFVLF